MKRLTKWEGADGVGGAGESGVHPTKETFVQSDQHRFVRCLYSFIHMLAISKDFARLFS